MEFFGYELRRKGPQPNTTPTFAPNEPDDGALMVAPGGAYATYVDLDGSIRTDAELVTKYREMAQYPEVDSAIDDVVNELIVSEPDVETVTVNLDNLQQPENIKELIRQEFKTILELLDFKTNAYDIARRWYIDGRLYYHAIIDINQPQAGIQEFRYIDPRKIRKVKEVRRKRDPNTIATIINNESEYFVYNEKGFQTTGNSPAAATTGAQGLKIAKDSIVYVTSGILDKNNRLVLSYLHKALKPLNMLRSIEDATIIYRISRAPERRVFYIDVGNLPKMKAEQYVRDIMTKFKNRVVYDSTTGEIRDDRKFMTMLEDFWLPRREGGRGTEITTLPAGQNLGELSDVKYFQRNLYKSLNVPIGRLEPEANMFGGSGRAAEITRDEIKFAKFIQRLRLKFSNLFLESLKKQLILKGIITVEDWQVFEQSISFDYAMDNYFAEIKEGEMVAQRVNLLNQITPYIGRFYSNRWVQENILQMSEDEILKMQKEIQVEIKERPDLFPELQAQQQQQQQDSGN